MTATIRRDPAVWQAYKEHVTTAVAEHIGKASPAALSSEMAAWIAGLNARADRSSTFATPLPQAMTSALTQKFHGSHALTAGAVATEAGAKDVWLAGAQVAVKHQLKRALDVVGVKDLGVHLDQAIALQQAIIRTKAPTDGPRAPAASLHVTSVTMHDEAHGASPRTVTGVQTATVSSHWPARPGIGGRSRAT